MSEAGDRIQSEERGSWRFTLHTDTLPYQAMLDGRKPYAVVMVEEEKNRPMPGDVLEISEMIGESSTSRSFVAMVTYISGIPDEPPGRFTTVCAIEVVRAPSSGIQA